MKAQYRTDQYGSWMSLTFDGEAWGGMTCGVGFSPTIFIHRPTEDDLKAIIAAAQDGLEILRRKE